MLAAVPGMICLLAICTSQTPASCVQDGKRRGRRNVLLELHAIRYFTGVCFLWFKLNQVHRQGLLPVLLLLWKLERLSTFSLPTCVFFFY